MNGQDYAKLETAGAAALAIEPDGPSFARAALGFTTTTTLATLVMLLLAGI